MSVASEPPWRGGMVDGQGRCIHWAGPDDVLLIALPCCAGFWACRDCHDEEADHEALRWPADSHEQALMCGRCGSCFTIQKYLHDADACPSCRRAFNPRCRLHHHLYFEPGPDRQPS